MQVVASFLAIFRIVMLLTSFQDPSGITLKEVRLIKPSLGFCSVATPAPADLDLGAVAAKFGKGDPGYSFPTNAKSFFNGPHGLSTKEPALRHLPICHYSTKMGSAGSIFF